MPHYPLDGQPATVEIYSLKEYLDFNGELSSFPGPLVRQVTHKGSVISWCQKKLAQVERREKTNKSDHEALILLWKLLILLLRQNGVCI